MSSKKNKKIKSEEIQDILTSVPNRLILWGNTIVLIIILFFFLLSALIKYPDIINAEVTITSRTPLQKVYARATGKIDTILVKENDRVDKGQTLLMIENSANLKDVLLLKKYIENIETEEQIFDFPIDSVQALNLGEIATRYTSFESNYLNFLLNNQLQPYKNKIQSNSLLRSELISRLEILKTQKNLEEETYKLSEKSLKRNKQLFKNGVISEQEYEREQGNLLKAENNLKNLNISISQLKQSINQLEKESSQTVIDSKFEKTRLYKLLLLELNQLKNSIRNWELKYVSQANIEGAISLMNVWTEYETVTKGDLLLTIIPENNTNYIAKIKAPIRNSGKIKNGQPVIINLSNFPETEYGSLKGTVDMISAIPDESGFYFITVFLEEPLITSYDFQIPFSTELSGTAEIITEDLTLIERLFYSIRGIFG